jgi:hypothetical protein
VILEDLGQRWFAETGTGEMRTGRTKGLLHRCGGGYAFFRGGRRNLQQSLPAKIRRKFEPVLVLHDESHNVSPAVQLVSILKLMAD